MRNIKTLAFGLVTLFVASALIVPTASAQTSTQPSLTFDKINVAYSQGDSNAIVPDTGKATVSIDWTWTINQQGFDQAGFIQSSTLLSFTQPSCENSAVKVSGSTSYPIILREGAGAAGASDEGTAQFTVTATQQAPGETLISCTFKAQSEPIGNQVQSSNEASINTDVVVKYLGLISATIPTTIKQAGPQKQIQYDIEVTNLGNSITNMVFTLRDSEAASSGGWNPVPPTPVVLQSTAQGGTDTVKTVSFLISTPFKNGWNNAEKTFTLDITPQSTKNPDFEGSTVTVNVLARVRGVYVPSLEPMVMVGAVIGAAMLARKLRDEE